VISHVRFFKVRGCDKEHMMKASVDPNLCTGCGLCVETCPEVFKMGDDDVAVVILDQVLPEVEDTCREAADDCPVDAIVIEN